MYNFTQQANERITLSIHESGKIVRDFSPTRDFGFSEDGLRFFIFDGKEKILDLQIADIKNVAENKGTTTDISTLGGNISNIRNAFSSLFKY